MNINRHKNDITSSLWITKNTCNINNKINRINYEHINLNKNTSNLENHHTNFFKKTKKVDKLSFKKKYYSFFKKDAHKKNYLFLKKKIHIHNSLRYINTSFSTIHTFLKRSKYCDVAHPNRDYSEQLNEKYGSISRVRFKPGYQTMWRSSREVFKEVYGLKYKYQHSLTKHLLRFSNKTSSFFLYYGEFSIEKIILFSKLLPNQSTLVSFFSEKYIYLNGSVIKNTSTTIFSGDVVQVVTGCNELVYYYWSEIWNNNQSKKFKKLIFRKTKNNGVTLMKKRKQRSYHTPKWVSNSRYNHSDVRFYLELDYFTNSVVHIYEPYVLTHYSIESLNLSRDQIFRMYNWKYIN